MKRRTVGFSPEAQNDLLRLYDWIAVAAGAYVAIGYMDRLEAYCLGFEFASERGHRRDDIATGMRIIGFEKRVTIAFIVGNDEVTILRVFYGGQDWESVKL
jgi:toxin ParE1/3/4